MAYKVKKDCPICGKEFTPCSTDIPSALNWRTVVCSEICAKEWFRQVEEDRKSKNKVEKPIIKKKVSKRNADKEFIEEKEQLDICENSKIVEMIE